MNKNIKISGLLIALAFSGCEKDDNKIPSGIYLSKVIYHQNADQIRHYSYNDQGLLATREYEFDDVITEKFEYLYKNGLINRIDFYELNNSNDNTFSLREYLNFDYDMGHIVKSIRYPDLTETDYDYADDKVKKIVHSLDRYTEYQYDSAGNIREGIVYQDNNEYWKFSYKYDDKKNPFYDVDPIHDNYSRVDLIKYKCPNNLIYESFVNEYNDTISVSEYIYEYNLNDLPTISYELYTSESNGYERDSMHTLLYEYEIR